MLYKINCTADIATQSTGYPTYKGIDCDLHINDNEGNFHGANIDCDLAIITTLADACKAKIKGIRTRITINGVDVTAALKGYITIQHNKNQISVFSLQLGDSQYSPLNNSNISLNKVVIINTYINGFGTRVFTGLIDKIDVDYSLDNFLINISGSDYGKKLRDKKMTLVSVQDLAAGNYRGNIIQYLANQAGVYYVNTPMGSYTRIDHSFNSQSILDMITKELIIDSYWWHVDENGILCIGLDDIKTNTTTYPTADWTYGEGQITRLGLTCGPLDNIINSIKVLGTVYETQVEVDNPEDSISSDYVTSPPAGYTTTQLCNFQHSFASGEDATTWTETDGGFTLTVEEFGTVWGTPPIKVEYLKFKISWNSTQDYAIDDFSYAIDGMAQLKETFSKPNYTYVFVSIKRLWDGSALGAFNISMTIEGKEKEIQQTPEDNPPTSAIVDNEEVASPTYEYHYDQVGAEVVDSNSIAKYGLRKTDAIEFRLAENIDQCKGIGKKIIKDSHRLLEQPDFEVGLNPLLKIGQTIAITDKKTGHSANRWYVEQVIHTIGQGYGDTKVGCVYYA